jgi:D-alanyl-D-alanine carboxypeptidase
MPNLITIFGVLGAFVLALLFLQTDIDVIVERSTQQNVEAMAGIHNLSLQPVLQGQLAPPVVEKALPFRPKSEDVGNEIPDMSSYAYHVVDLETRQNLAYKNIFDQRQLASVTKIMTAMIVLDEYQWGQGEFLAMSESAFATYGGNSIRVGESFPVEDYVKALLIASSNDSATLLAERFGDGDVERFLWKMNQKSKRLNLTQTVFANPSGLDETNRPHFSTAQQVTEMGMYSYKNYPQIWEILAQESVVATSSEGRQIEIRNTNRILQDEFIFAGKTGMTEEARETFFVILEVEGRKVAVTLMGAEFGGGRFSDTEKVYQWLMENFTVVE